MLHFMFHSTSEKKSCFKLTNQMPQKIEISTSMRDKQHMIIEHKHFSVNLHVRKRALHAECKERTVQRKSPCVTSL